MATPARRIVAALAVAGIAIATLLALPRPDAELAPRSIYAYLGLEGRGAETRRLDREAAVERLTANCMRAAGFAYVPQVIPLPSILDGELSPLEWARKWGFGIATTFDAPVVQAPVVRDPNRDFALSLSPDGQRRYMRTLLGQASEPDANGFGNGCLGEANRAIHGRLDEILAPVLAVLEQISRDARSDSRWETALHEWTSCIQERGYEAEEPQALSDAVRSDIISRLETIVGPPPGRPDYDRSALRALQLDERASASNVAECQASLEAARLKLIHERELAFMGSHESVLVAVRDELHTFEADVSRWALDVSSDETAPSFTSGSPGAH